MRKGIMALEGMEELVEDAPAGDATEFVDAPEGDLAEMTKAVGEVESLDADIDESADTSETLEVMGDSLEQSAAEGGMSEPEARAVEVAVEHFRNRLGFPKRQVMPAMESFSNKSRRVAVTLEAAASIKDIAKKVWEGIINAFNQAIAWIKKVWEHMTDATKKYASRAEAMIKAAKAKVATKAPADAKVSVSGVIKTLNVGGKMLPGGEFVSKYEEFTKTAVNLAKYAFAVNFGKEVNAMLVAIKDPEGFKVATVNAVEEMKKLATGAATTNKDIKAEDGMSVFEEPRTFGQVSVYTSLLTDASQAEKFGKCKVFLAASANAVEVGKAEDATPLTPVEVIKVADAAKVHMNSYQSFQANMGALEKAQRDVQTNCKKAAAEFGTFEKAEGKTNARVAAAAARSVISITTAGMAAVRSNDIAITKNALDFCGASLKVLDSKEDLKESDAGGVGYNGKPTK